MKKEKYENPVMEIIEFETDDIIITSNDRDEGTEWALLYSGEY